MKQFPYLENYSLQQEAHCYLLIRNERNFTIREIRQTIALSANLILSESLIKRIKGYPRTNLNQIFRNF